MRQIISVSEIPPQDAASEFSFDVTYNTDPLDETLAGLGLRLHFDSSILNLNEVENIFQNGFIAEDVQADTENEDDDPNTDQFINIAWADVTDAAWPGEGETPTRLFTASFTTDPDFLDQSTTLNFTATDTASGYDLSGDDSEDSDDLEDPSVTVESSGETGGDAPNISLPETVEIDENTTEVLTNIEAEGDLTFSISSGADADLFTIDENTGELNFREAPDFENPESASGDNNYQLEVRATNESNLSDQEALTVAVQDVEEAPVVEDSSFSLPEDSSEGTEVGTVSIRDAESDDLTFNLSGELDLNDNGENAFAIDETGLITVNDSEDLDLATQPRFEFEVTAEDPAGNIGSGNVTVDLINESLRSDLNGDGIVNAEDLDILSAAFRSSNGDDNFNATADITGDDIVNLNDLGVLASQFEVVA